MLGGGGVGEMKDLYCRDSGVLKGALKETRFRAGFFFFFFGWGKGGVTLLNIESIGGGQIWDREEEGEGLPFPVVFFVIFNHIPN